MHPTKGETVDAASAVTSKRAKRQRLLVGGMIAGGVVFAASVVIMPSLALLLLAGIVLGVGGIALVIGLKQRSLDVFLFLSVLVTDIGIFRTFNVGIEVNPQVAMKVAVAVGAGAVGLLWWRASSLTRMHTGLLAYVGLCVFSVLYSPTKAFSAGAAAILAAQVMLVIALSTQYRSAADIDRTLKWLFSALAVKIVLSWSLLAVDPALVFERSSAFTEAKLFAFPRFAGLAGPNTTALNAAVLITIAVAAIFVDGIKRSKALIAFGSLGVLTLVLTQSRTAMLAVVVASAVVAFYSHRKAFVALCLIAAILSPIALEWDSTDLLRVASRTGREDEALSMAGRTAIWSAVTERIADSPLFGFGYGSGRYIIGRLQIEGATRPFHSAHNFFLESTLNVGLVGTALLTAMLLAAFRSALTRRRWSRLGTRAETQRLTLLALLTVVLVNGMTESGMAGVLALPSIVGLWAFGTVSRVPATEETAIGRIPAEAGTMADPIRN